MPPRENMLDPFTSLSVATSVVQFIDFAAKLVSQAGEIYSSADGITVEYAELDAVARNMVQLDQDLRRGEGTTGLDRETREICSACRTSAAELIEAIDGLKSQGAKSKWKSMYRALCAVWGSKKVEALARRLDRLRSQLNMDLLGLIRYVASSRTRLNMS